MQKLLSIFFFIALFFLSYQTTFSQVKKDSAAKVEKKITDTVPTFKPRIATIRSAIIPGWGQIYNRKYWKLPLVYGALGTTAGIFFYNIKNYNLLKKAYIIISNNPLATDSIAPQFRKLDANSIKTYRNAFRQNVDYSVIFFILFWGLNVMDATVDAQLKAFDVNDNLSLKFKPGYSPLANTTGLSLVMDIHSKAVSASR